MTTLNPPTAMLWRFPTRVEWRHHMTNTKVAVTLILGVTWLITVFVAAVVYLAATEHSTEALTAAIVAPLVGALVAVGNQLRGLKQAVKDSPNINPPE